MKVLLTTCADHPWSRELRREFETLAGTDRVGEHALASTAAEADLVVFVDAHQHPSDWMQRTMRQHPLVREDPSRVFVYDERDEPRDVLPGVYVSMPRSRFDPRRHRALSYYRVFMDTRAVADMQPELLFSFVGRRLGGVRDAVLRLCDEPRAVVEDSSAYDFFSGETPELAAARARYGELMGRSKFVLCPRGAGTSSLRLFETMACGRVPVIISDDWVPPSAVDWDRCSVRIAEGEIETIPQRLRALEADWQTLGVEARRAYEDWFGQRVWFHRMVELCLEIREQGAVGLRSQWNDPHLWRLGARYWKSRVRSR